MSSALTPDRLLVVLAPTGVQRELARWASSFAATAPGRTYRVEPRRRRVTSLPGEPPGLLHLMRTEQAPPPVPDTGWSLRLLTLGDVTTDGDVLAEPHLHLVQSRPPDEVGHPDYDVWYAEHMRENLQIEGFANGWRGWQRAQEPGREPRPVPPHVAVYSMDRAWDEVAASMAANRERLSASWPAWFDRIEFTPLEAIAVEG